MKKVKLFIFILLIIFLIIVFFYGIFGTGISYLSSKEIKQSRQSNKNLIRNLNINNLNTVYDKNNNIYYYTLPVDYENKIYVLKLELENGFKYKLIDETLNIVKVDYSNPIDIIIYNDKYYCETKIQLTNIPLINIETEYDITTNDTKSVFTYINHNNSEVVINNSKIHIRGATSQYFEKKSYKINMYDKNYNEEKEINVSNFYYGNSFILDAVYRDPSKIRNILSIELWNEISNDFSNININSEFVELFINDEYKGLYVLTEPINRRSLNLNKSSDNDTSIIIKSQEWNNLNSNMNFSNIEDDFYLNYEMKYPNNEDLFSASWEKILTKMSGYYDSYLNSSDEIIEYTWNLENYIDMIIFNSFINNSDNRMIKNNYFYIKKLKQDEVFIQPWDMEYTFGIKYKKDSERNVSKNMEDYNEFYAQFYHKNAPKTNKILIDRYWKLRKEILNKEYFDNLLNKYKSILNKGAALRDSKLWYEYDIEKEIEEIRTWIYNRLEYFDSYVKDLENE